MPPMAAVPDKVLSWLYSVLHEYHDPQRTYSDAVRTLSVHPLSPRTEVYTYENGASALLLTLSNTIPVVFRGTTYHFPLKIWIPHAYPHEAPIVYVTPGKDMLVRPGQHVAVDGRVYHPYLRDWNKMWDRASLVEFLDYLRQVFSKEPPVISRAQQQQYQPRPAQHIQQQAAGASMSPPQLPPKQSADSTVPPRDESRGGPPPLPPKPGEEHAESSQSVARTGPPLPPLPHERAQPRTHNRPLSEVSVQSFIAPPPDFTIGGPAGPPVRQPLPHDQAHYIQQQYSINQNQLPVSPAVPHNGYSELQASRYSQPGPLTVPPPMQLRHYPVQQAAPYPQQPRERQHMQRQTLPHPAPHIAGNPLAPPQQLSAQQVKQQTPDLLTDPFDVALPGLENAEASVTAPPIPPNPEKEHLLQAITSTLVQQAQKKVSQNISARAPLQAQQQALQAAQQRLEGEIRQLEQLEQALSNNEAILRRSIQDCDVTISTAKSTKQPPIDEVLIAPTMVANQLWTLAAEEASCREAMYVLQKAVDRGRISGTDFVRQMRGLGRECFLKMALARKCARGMGLEVQQR